MEKSRPEPGRRTALNRAIYMAILVASILPMGIILGVMQVHLETAYREVLFRSLQEIADRHSQKVDDFLRERLTGVRVLADLQHDRLLDQGALSAQLGRLQSILGGVYVDMGLVDAKGIQHYYAGPLHLENIDYADKEWFRHASARDIFISDVFLGVRNSPHFIVALKIMLRGEPWILRSTIDFASFVRLVEDVRVGTTGMASIINRKGEFQTAADRHHPNEGPELAALARRLFDTTQDVPRPERVFLADDTVYAMSLLKGGEWVLVVQQDKTEAFRGLDDAQQTLRILLAVISVGVLVGGVLLAWRIIDRIDLMEMEKAVLNSQVVEAGKLSALGEMAAGIAHEINNPVAIMMEEAGWVEDVLADMPPDGNRTEIARSAAQIRTQGKRCRDITHKLLSFARKADTEMTAVDVNAVLREMVALCGQRAHTANVAVSMELAEDLPAVVASPSELQQVFLNLFNNAIDAMEGHGGALRVGTRLNRDGEVTVTLADTGPGIPEPVLQRIYDPFFTTKPVGKGTGLGLSICYGIIKRLGGSIRVDSMVGVGTTFEVHLQPHEGTTASMRHD